MHTPPLETQELYLQRHKMGSLLLSLVLLAKKAETLEEMDVLASYYADKALAIVNGGSGDVAA